MGLIEIHSHLLPYVDDGVSSQEESLSMLDAYAQAGFTRIIVTPHLYNPYVTTHVKNIREMFSWFAEEAEKRGITAELGSETFIGSAREPKTIPFGDGFVLIEVETRVEPLYLVRFVKSKVEEGKTVILAHIERYNWLTPNHPTIFKLRELGVLFQSNCKAIKTGQVEKYLEKDLVDIIAGDNHGDPDTPALLRDTLAENPRVLSIMNRLFNMS